MPSFMLCLESPAISGVTNRGAGRQQGFWFAAELFDCQQKEQSYFFDVRIVHMHPNKRGAQV